MSRRKQSELILDWLRQGNRIDPMVALVKFNCLRLAARIYDLREDGHEIITRPIETKSGKTVAQYALVRSA